MCEQLEATPIWEPFARACAAQGCTPLEVLVRLMEQQLRIWTYDATVRQEQAWAQAPDCPACNEAGGVHLAGCLHAWATTPGELVEAYRQEYPHDPAGALCTCQPGTAGWARHHGSAAGTLPEAFHAAMGSDADIEQEG